MTTASPLLITWGETHLAGPLLLALCTDYDAATLAELIPPTLRKNAYRYYPSHPLQKQLDRLASLLQWQEAWVEAEELDQLGLVSAQEQAKVQLLAAHAGAPYSWQAEAALRHLARHRYAQVMLQLHQRYPQYDWEHNLGAPTAAHYEALIRHGPVVGIHRLRTLRSLPSWIYRNQHRVGRTLPAWWRRLYGESRRLLDWVTPADIAERRRRRRRRSLPR